jgi:hypothetical protein
MEAEIAMDLSFLLTTITLCCLAYAGFTWVNSAYIAPWRSARAPATVKNKPRLKGFKKRSARSQGSEPLNAGSGQQDAKPESVHVQTSVQRSAAAPPAGAAAAAPEPAGDGFTLSPRELVQLGEALNLYREGATIEQAVCRAFGVTKGGSEGWRRAKSLFDAATVPPGAAPAGTYEALRPVKRRRRVVAAR